MDVVRAYVHGTHGSLPVVDYGAVSALLSEDFIFLNEEQQHDKNTLLGAIFPGSTYLAHWLPHSFTLTKQSTCLHFVLFCFEQAGLPLWKERVRFEFTPFVSTQQDTRSLLTGKLITTARVDLFGMVLMLIFLASK